MTRKTMMADLDWIEYQRRVCDERQAVLLPIGAIEQHGPHLPLSTDLLISEAVAVGVAQEWPCIIAPSLPYGCKSQCRSGGGNHFCGTTSLDASTFIAQLVDIIRELARHGARKLGLVDIHYENEMYVLEACDLAIRELRYGGVLDFRIIRPIATALLNLDLLTPFYPEGFSTIALEHAGKLETSIMLYLQPELVAQDRFPENIVAKFPPYDAFPPETRHVPPSGALCPTSGACRELGEVVIKDIVRGYVNSFQKGFSEQ